MRLLILGGGGMLGHRLAMDLRHECDTWVTVRGAARHYARYGFVDPGKIVDGIDAANFDAVVDAVGTVLPDAVINCIGIIKQLPSAHDPIPSLAINALLPQRLHNLCRASRARLIHFSTDCVFNGRKGRYTEADPSDAEDLYGRTKYLGETEGPGALTIRSSIIGRELSTASGLIEWFRSQHGKRVEGYTRAIYTGFTTQAMARIVRSMLFEYPELHGTWHVSSDPISKFDLLTLVRDACGLQIEIVPSDRVQIDRTLDSTRFRARTGFRPPSWPAMVKEMAADPAPYDEWRRFGGIQHHV